MSVKGGVYVHEAYEVKKIKHILVLCECMGPTSLTYHHYLHACLCVRVYTQTDRLTHTHTHTHTLCVCVCVCVCV
jgi:hypothetical protein